MKNGAGEMGIKVLWVDPVLVTLYWHEQLIGLVLNRLDVTFSDLNIKL